MLQFKGSIVALVTPMQSNGELDKPAFCELVKWHISNGTKGIVVGGTTGESATLSLQEFEQLVEWAVTTAQGQIPILAGSGTNDTKTSIEKSRIAQELQVDGLLLVTPYYNKPPQSGLLYHFQQVAEKVHCPILLYNVPSRTGCDLLPETVAELSRVENIVGIKEATGSMERLVQLQVQCTKDFIFLSGDDATFVEFMQNGGHGVISVTANIIPKTMQTICEHCLNQEFSVARQMDDKIQSLHRELMVESNPIPVKWALQHMGKISSGIRAPLRPLLLENQASLTGILQQTITKM